MDTLTEARKRRADELALRYDDQLKKHGCETPERKSIFKTAYLCAVTDMQHTISELEQEIMDLRAEIHNGRVYTDFGNPYVAVSRPV